MWKSIHWLALFALAAIFLVANWITAGNYPAWTDDVMQIDAGVNLALGQGWSSTAWPSQSRAQFWAGNNPLFPLLLSGWVAVFGFSVWTVRAFGYVLTVASAAVIVGTAWRARWVTSAWLGILLGMLVLCDFGTSNVYRSGRADIVPMLVIALLVSAWFGARDAAARKGQLFLIALLIVPSGLQIIPYIAILIACDSVLRRQFRAGDTLAVMAGCAVGAALLPALFAWQGQAYAFLSQTAASGYSMLGAGLQAGLIGDEPAMSRLLAMLDALRPMNIANSIVMNPSLSPLLLALLIAVAAAKIAPRGDIRLLGLSGLAAILAVVLGMLLAGRFPIYYAWMASVPAAVFVAAAIQKFADVRARVVVAGLLTAVVLAIALGLPRQLVSEVRAGGPILFVLANSIVATEAGEGDVLYGDPALHYPAKTRRLDFYSTTYAGGRGYRDILPAERDAVTLLIVLGGQEADAMTKLGGGWSLARAYPVQPGEFQEEWRVFRRPRTP
jgi:hypothetical protein